jgi:hypothetical protein
MGKETRKRRDKIIYSSLVVKAPNRATSDIGTWRAALRSADGGRPARLFDLYDDLLVDGVLADARGKRVDAVNNAELVFQDKRGKAVKEIDEIMNTLAWENLLTGITGTIFTGRSGVELDFANGFDTGIIPPKHVSIENRLILIDPTGEKGIPYTGDDHLIVLGKRFDYGLFLKTAPFAIYKRGGFGDYAQWLEIFGMPQRVGKYSAYDPESRKLLEEAMERQGSAPWLVIPKETDVETVNKSGSGSSGISFNNFRQACNEEMLVTILGQTLTTIQGDRGARSLGEVHKLVEEGKNKSDMRFVEKVLNTYLVPVLERRGFPVNGGRFIFPEAVEPLKVSEIVELSGIMPVPVSFLRNKYGIPEPVKGEEIAGKRPVEDKKEDSNPGEPGKEKNETGEVKGETGKEEIKEEVKHDNPGWWHRLLDFFAVAPTTWSGAGRKWSGRSRTSITLADGFKIDTSRLVNEAIRELYGTRGEELINRHLFDVTNNALQHGIDTSLAGVAGSNAAFVRQFKENTAVFAAFKNHLQTREMAALMIDGNGKLVPFYKFKKLALQLSERYNIKWLQTEYNTAVRAARAAANMIGYKKNTRLYPNLEYIETNAAHPRATHLAWVGTILPVDHEWWDTRLPPSDWNCDCGVRPTDKAPTPVPDDTGGINPVFANNPAKTAEFVKTSETPYYKHTSQELREKVIEEGLKFHAGGKIEKVYEGKNGGYLEIVKQGKNEMAKNVITYKRLADDGKRYRLLKVSFMKNKDNNKNPDAWNLDDNCYSDAKHPETSNGKAAIQNSIRKASIQLVAEVVIRLEQDYPSAELYEGLKAGLQDGRAGTIKKVILLRREGKPLYLDVAKLRERFKK